MKRAYALLCCLALLAAPFAMAGAEEFAPEDLTLHAFIDAMHEEHLKRHALIEGNYTLESGEHISIGYPAGVPYSILPCIEFYEDVPRKVSETSRDVEGIFMSIFSVVQAITLEPGDDTPLNLEKFEGKYNRKVFLGTSNKVWWATEESDEDTLLVVPMTINTANRDLIDDAAYVLCIQFEPEGIRVWLCADDYLVYAINTALWPPKADDRLVEWMNDREDYLQAVEADSTTEAAWRIVYAKEIHAKLYGN